MNLYLRLVWTWLRARLLPPVRPGDTIELRLRVLPNDLDINGHMNNGRYMTIADLALIEYFVRSGFLPVALRNGWRPMLGGSIISYRKGLSPFASYTLRFTVQCWDEHWNYMRFEFVRDGRVHAVGHSKGAVVGRGGLVRNEVAYRALGADSTSPAFPASVSRWIETEQLMVA